MALDKCEPALERYRRMKDVAPNIQVEHWRPIRSAYIASGLSLRELADATGIPKSRLSRILSGQTVLTVPTLQLLAIALNFDPRDIVRLGQDSLLGAYGETEKEVSVSAVSGLNNLLSHSKSTHRQSGGEISIEHVLAWYHQTNGQLENSSKIMPHLSIFSCPTVSAKNLDPVHIGQKSLAYETLASDDPEALKAYVDTLSSSTRREIISNYRSTSVERTYQIHARNVVVALPGVGRPYELHYATLLLPMMGLGRQDVVVNYSVLVSVKLLKSKTESRL